MNRPYIVFRNPETCYKSLRECRPEVIPGTYHVMRGVEEIGRGVPHVRRSDKPMGLHRPLIAFAVFMAFALMLLASILDSMGVK